MDTIISRLRYGLFILVLISSVNIASALTNDAPRNIEKITASLGANSIRLSWEAPVTGVNFPITDYIIQYKQQTSLKYATANDGKSSQTGYLLQNLNPNTLYNIRIIAVNSRGMSGYKVFRFTTKKTPTPGVCGSANTKVLTSFPSSGLLCKSGTPNIIDKVGTDGNYNWGCNGINSSISVTCQAQVSQASPGQSSLPPVTSAIPKLLLAQPSEYNSQPGKRISVQLYWELFKNRDRDYLQFMHIDNGQSTYSVDDHDFLFISSNSTISDLRSINVPQGITEGNYDILVGLSGLDSSSKWVNFPLAMGQGVINKGDNRYKVGTLMVSLQTPGTTPTPTPTPSTPLPPPSTPAYSYSWSSGTWGTCSLSCGGGTQARTVRCLRNDGMSVADSNCSSTKPITSQSCNTQVCGTSPSPGLTSNVYGPRVTNFETVVGPLYPKAGETISGKRISNPSGPCIVVNQPNVTIRDNEIGPCMHSPDSLNTPWGKSPNGFGVQIQGATNVTIEFNKFDSVTTGVYASDGASHPIVVRHNSITNIRGPFPRGQFVQFNTINSGNGQSRIYCNVSDVEGSNIEEVEDHINMYSSYGSTSPIEIAYNRIRGGHSINGSGIMTGDSSAAGAGGGISVHDNTVVDVANTGIGVAGGENIHIENNRVYMSGNFGPSRIGMYAYAYVPVGGTAPLCQNNSFLNNRVWAVNTIDGNGASNPFWHDTNTCFNIIKVGNVWGDTTLSSSIFNEIPQFCQDSAKQIP